MAEVDRQETQTVRLEIPAAAIWACLWRIVATLAGCWLIVKVWPVLLLVLLALMLVAALNPVVRQLQTRVPRSIGIAVVSITLVGFLVGGLALLLPMLLQQLTSLIDNAPQYARDASAMLTRHGVHWNLQHLLETAATRMTNDLPTVVAFLDSLVNGILGLGVVVVLTVYLLIEGPAAATTVLRLLPRDKRLPVRRLGSDIGGHVGGYVRGQLITSGLAGLVWFIVLVVTGVPQALALAAIAMVADAIPLVGLLIATLPAVMIALTLSGGQAATVLIVALLYHQLEVQIIIPRVYGKTLGLSLTVVLISLLIGAELMGILGALLALPVAAALPALGRHIRDEWLESE